MCIVRMNLYLNVSVSVFLSIQVPSVARSLPGETDDLSLALSVLIMKK